MTKYTWKITPEINKLVIELESIKLFYENQNINYTTVLNLRRNSLLKSAVYSARIEGFTDTLHIPKKESQNLLSAYNYIYSSKTPQKISTLFIKRLHSFVLKGISDRSGKFRDDTWAIFNQSGSVVYLAPAPIEIPLLLEEYLHLINSLSEHPAVKSAISQYIFEKIHPFPDGNGRVGRLLSAHMLHKSGYGFHGLIPFEEYIESHREEYYHSLETNLDCTEFIQYFLKALVNQLKNNASIFQNLSKPSPEHLLLPRRREILEIIRDHPRCSFDFLKRRFIKVKPKTLFYDLTQLQKHGFVDKLGSTRGALYKSSTISTYSL